VISSRGFSPPQTLAKVFMVESYWDLYVAYIDKCVRDNWANDIDPAHYEMEWNHFLPQCIFGDQPVGQWLLLEQHAIASALQTLAFQSVCVCPWHVKYLPAKLWELCKTIYSARQSEIGNKHVASGHWQRCQSLGGQAAYKKYSERVRVLGRVQGKINVDNGTLQKAREISATITRKPVIASQGSTHLTFPSISEASRQLKVAGSNIHKCLRGERKKAGGFQWAYAPR